jgi:predicted amidohydrolase
MDKPPLDPFKDILGVDLAPERNVARRLELIAGAADAGAKLAVLPEL